MADRPDLGVYQTPDLSEEAWAPDCFCEEPHPAASRSHVGTFI